MIESTSVSDSSAPLAISEVARQHMAATERRMLCAVDLADLFDLSVAGIRSITGGRHVEVWLHDPVNELDRHLDSVSVVSGKMSLMSDSYPFVSLYGDVPRWTRVTGESLNDTPLFSTELAAEQTLLLPILDHERLVGSVHVADARATVIADDVQMSILSDFVARLPLLVDRLIEMNRIRDFVLLDPVSHVANRAGLLRDLEREVSRARRNLRAPLLAGLRLEGLGDMSNLSQRHTQHRILRSVGSLISAGLRNIDSVARIAEDTFAVMVVDAPREGGSDIVARWEAELQGQLIDDGAGGMIELRGQSCIHECDLSLLEEMDSADIALNLLSEVERSLDAETV